jgi:hypothetical protein
VQIWIAWIQHANRIDDDKLYGLFVLIAQQHVGERPGRIEPRAPVRSSENMATRKSLSKCHSYLTPFFAAHVSSAAITFEYRFPNREVTVPRRDIERVVRGLDSEQSAWAPLVVYTKDGRRFESAPIKAEHFEGLKSRMRPAF